MAAETKNIGIRILEIKELSFSNKIIDEIVNDFDEEKVNIKLGFAVQGDSNKKNISISIIIHYDYPLKDSKKKKEFLTLETKTTFKVSDYDDNEIKFDDESNEIFINDEIMAIFLNASIGATRGMFAYKIASLPINLVIPLFDINELIGPKESSKKK